MTADDTRPDLPGGHGHAQGRRGPSSPGAGDLPAPARRAAEAAYRNWRIGDDGEGRLHAALVAAAPLIRADERERIRQLAVERGAVYCQRGVCTCIRLGSSPTITSFADLIREPS